jgi:hypothetical protein
MLNALYSLRSATMSFFFRRSVGFGPFRLNLSKSGIGASVGVKGARLTRSARGTTYVTVGENGFYYREALHRHPTPSAPEPERPDNAPSSTDEIPTVDSVQLVDSSSEKLISQLNERAKVVDPSGWFLAGGLMLLALTFTAPDMPRLPDLPDVSLPERSAQTTDEYSALTLRYGQPDSVRVAVLDASTPVPVGSASYKSAGLAVLFVPNGCYSEYKDAVRILAEGAAPRSSVRRRRMCCK